MAKTRVVLNHAGFQALLTSAEVEADVMRRAEKVAAAAGDGYEVLPNDRRRGRAGATVAASSAEAKRDEARDHKLLGALDAGRG